MNKVKNLRDIVRYWTEKSKESLDTAEDELKANRLSFSVNRIYYACFYAVSAVLLHKGYRFKKEKVEEWLNQAEIFVKTLKRLVD